MTSSRSVSLCIKQTVCSVICNGGIFIVMSYFISYLVFLSYIFDTDRV